MTVRSRGSPAPDEQEMGRIAEDLRSTTSVQTILKRLRALSDALEDNQAADRRALAFSRAGGLPTLVRLLGGKAMRDSTALPDNTFAWAGEALSRVLSSGPVMAELACAADLIPPLIDALRDAPDDLGRSGAANGLMLLSRDKPEHRRAIAEGAVMAPLLELYVNFGSSSWPMGIAEPARKLASALVHSGTVAVRDLGRAIRGQKAMTSFAALLVLQDSTDGAGGAFVAALDEAGIVDALVSTLKHESPYCVGAAAAALHMLEKTPGGGQALVEASGALPALVRVLERARPPGRVDRENELCRRSAFNYNLQGKKELISYNNPTALAAVALGGMLMPNLTRQPIVESFIKAGGVPAAVQLLNKSTCPLTLSYAGNIIETMLFLPGVHGRPNWTSERAHMFHKAGLCQAILHILKGRAKSMHEQMLRCLIPLVSCLSASTKSAAISMLVVGGIVEIVADNIAKAGRDLVVPVVLLLRWVLAESEARRRLCMPSVVDQLSKWMAKWLLQADGAELKNLCILLPAMFFDCPCYIPAAIKANVMPGLVRTLRKLRKKPEVEGPLLCLVRLTMDHASDVFKPAIVQPLAQALKAFFCPLSNERILHPLLMVSRGLLLEANAEGKGQWGPGLLREIAQLVTERAPAAAHGPAVEMLLKVGKAHPELMADWPKWGIEGSLERLTMHSDHATAVRASQLEVLLFCAREDPALTAQITASLAENSPAATTSPSSNRTQDCQSRTTGPSQPTRPKASAAGNLHSRSPAEKGTDTGASHVRAATGKAQACSRCGTTAEVLGQGKLKECGGCRTVRYCGKACQNADWPVHKAACKRLQTARG